MVSKREYVARIQKRRGHSVFSTVIPLLLLVAVCATNSSAELLAFPSAEGYGRFAKGGRGGRVIKVTNLNDDGPGSLRDAVDQTGPRTVIFDISGVIKLKSKLVVTGTKKNSFITIAGQTAPGKGVCLSGWTVGMIGGEHTIMRHMRVRVGTESGKTMDGMGMASATNSIFDHCSVSWTIDEAFSSRSAQMITLQRCLISEALNEAGHSKYPAGSQHGFAASISGDIGSFHHNLLAHCAGRNWSLAGGLKHGTLEYAGRLDIRNNVVYNWSYRTTDGGAHEVNFVNNYYKPGPELQIKVALNAQNDGFEGGQRYYFVGNVMEGIWDESNQEKGRMMSGKKRDYNPWVDKPFFESYVTTQSAKESYTSVLDDVGANRPVLDDHDKRVIKETRDGTFTYKGSKTGKKGLIDNEKDCGGLEDYPVIKRAADWDTDNDGMPNAWEEKHGLNPNNKDDGNKTTLSREGYTNLEMYLNEMAGDVTELTTGAYRGARKVTSQQISTIAITAQSNGWVKVSVDANESSAGFSVFDLKGTRIQKGVLKNGLAEFSMDNNRFGTYVLSIGSTGLRKAFLYK